jgi:hypothetical protein
VHRPGMDVTGCLVGVAPGGGVETELPGAERIALRDRDPEKMATLGPPWRRNNCYAVYQRLDTPISPGR